MLATLPAAQETTTRIGIYAIRIRIWLQPYRRLCQINAASEAAEKARFSTSAPEGVVEKTLLTARLKASPDTNL
jgi:hypothetical protein